MHQHDPDQPVLANTIQRLLRGPLGLSDANPQLLNQMKKGMEHLAERDADLQLAYLVQQLKR